MTASSNGTLATPIAVTANPACAGSCDAGADLTSEFRGLVSIHSHGSRAESGSRAGYRRGRSDRLRDHGEEWRHGNSGNSGAVSNKLAGRNRKSCDRNARRVRGRRSKQEFLHWHREMQVRPPRSNWLDCRARRGRRPRKRNRSRLRASTAQGAEILSWKRSKTLAVNSGTYQGANLGAEGNNAFASQSSAATSVAEKPNLEGGRQSPEDATARLAHGDSAGDVSSTGNARCFGAASWRKRGGIGHGARSNRR